MAIDSAPVLLVPNLYKDTIPGLGTIRRFEILSEKRVTSAIREKLRVKFGESQVHVTCKASFQDGFWKGQCEINGKSNSYIVKKE